MDLKIDFEVLNTLAKHVYQDNKAKGFWDDCEIIDKIDNIEVGGSNISREDLQRFKEDFKKSKLSQMIALQHSELSEALEADRNNLMDDKLPHRSGLEVELADALIRIMDTAGGLDLDIGGAVLEKLAYNKSRPYKHGKDY